ncbi:MAG: 5-formyltetrahydrofolate cyclo-ligase [Magnetovibrio sp.]|nr:5-formyltetrahydrofolate cyclo-ligase [Magnetovibrio sp.]|tara:strand:- start:517 stop:1119 length:603 start_codon:yes stop_codon:yes gene_type:complete
MNNNKQKAEFRKIAKKIRAKVTNDERLKCKEELVASIQQLAPVLGLTGKKTSISAYWPIADEIDVRPIMFSLVERGHLILLPVIQGPAAPLLFREWTPGTKLFDGGYGTSAPGPDSEERVPSVLLIPVLAFDNTGFRLGYGGGFYDRTLHMLRVKRPKIVSVGVAFESQCVDKIPVNEHDERLDFIVTEAQVRRFSNEPS